MKYHKNYLGFTLMELIVTITILAILGTIAFIALEGYSKQARDTKRISDMSRIKTSLELFSIEAGKYPDSTNPDTVNYAINGSDLWYQGSFGMQTFRNVEKLDKLPLDPITEKQYIYSVTYNKKEYQLGGILETDDFAFYNTNQANAIAVENNFRVIGNYNGKMLKVNKGSNTTILAIPSIITLCGTEISDVINNNYFVHNGFNRFPREFNGIGTYTQCDGLGNTLVNSGSLVLFHGNIGNLIGEENKQNRIDLVSNLQNAYKGTYLATNDDSLKSILSIDTINNSDGADLLGQGIITGNISSMLTSSSTSSISSGVSSIIDGGFSDFDLPGIGPVQLYTKVIDGKNYVLLRNTDLTMTQSSNIDPETNGVYVSDDIWGYFKNNSDNIKFEDSVNNFMFGVNGNLKYMRENTGTCSDLTSTLSQVMLYHHEDNGCDETGQDYTLIPSSTNLHLYTISSKGPNIANISLGQSSSDTDTTDNTIRGVRASIPSSLLVSGIDGICGIATGGDFKVFPTTNLCESGLARNNIDHGPGKTYEWKCRGINGGAVNICSANNINLYNMEGLFIHNTSFRGNEGHGVSYNTLISYSHEGGVPSFTSKENFTSGKYYLEVDSSGCEFSHLRYGKRYFLDFDNQTLLVTRKDNGATITSSVLNDGPMYFTLSHCGYDTHKCTQTFLENAVSPDPLFINYLNESENSN